MDIMEIQKEAHQIAKDKGWWDKDRDIPHILMLIVSELSEALEEYKKDNTTEGLQQIYFKHPVPRPDNKPEGFAVEIIDTLIRIFDMAEWIGIDTEKVLRTKMDYNRVRPYRHGGKKA